ncbi:MAG TPA: BlaI/MecI/CopY family transcriptional regulator [Polyangiaceae bacterium]|jgi:predicted transcriptional regulator|nr:BlaI/MecI/CopY family transcriptional regulator [Polyangiaceae bacterium]
MRSNPLTELQLELMQALWKLGAGSVSDVQAALEQSGRPLAVTTIATLLKRLEKQGWVRHKAEGRQFIYQPKVRQEQAAKSALQRLVNSFFGGSISSVAAELLDSENVTREDLQRMRQLLEKKDP